MTVRLLAVLPLVLGLAQAPGARQSPPPARPALSPARPPAVAPANRPRCGSVRLGRFRPQAGEKLSYRLDLLGADVGTFEITTAAAPDDRAALTMSARARTSAFVSTNVKRYEAYSESTLDRDLRPRGYKEDVDDGQEHKAEEVKFAPGQLLLDIHATRNGDPVPLKVESAPEVRDMLSTFAVVRALPLRQGSAFCINVYAAHHVWEMEGKVAAFEDVDAPLERARTARIDATATRIDDRNIVRSAHFWVTTDDRRLPLAAIAEFKGKVVRAQLASASAPGKKRLRASRR